MIPQFVITTAGLAAASVANPEGPYINIKSFKVGSQFGYEPTVDDEDIHGNIIYTGTPKSYSYVDQNTISIVCELPANIGPFAFGEIGVYLRDGTLFALAAFNELHQKYNIAASGLPHIISFNCHLKLAQTPAAFNVTTLTHLNLLHVPTFDFVQQPQSVANEPTAMIVAEGDLYGDGTLLIKKNDNHWTPVGWEKVKDFVVNGGTTSQLTSTDLAGFNHYSTDPQMPDYAFLIRVNTGAFMGQMRWSSGVRHVTAFVAGTPFATPLPVGTTCSLYRRSGSAKYIFNADLVNMWTRLKRIIGAPTFASTQGFTYFNSNDGSGYGQTLPAALNGPTQTVEPKFEDWDTLIKWVTAYESLAYSHTPDLNPQTPLASNPAVQARPESAILRLEEKINRIENNAGKVYKSKYVMQIARAFSRVYTAANPWDHMRVDLACSWGSVPALTSYFNAGGYIDFTIKSTTNSYIEYILNRMAMLMGPIRFGRFGVQSMGPMRLKFMYGDGYILPAGQLGLQGCAGVDYNRMFSYWMPLNVREEEGKPAGGWGKADEMLMVELYAGGSIQVGQLKLSLRVYQTTFDKQNIASPTNPGFQIQTSESGLASSSDESLGSGSYLSTVGTGWEVPNQRADCYVFFGKPNIPGYLNLNYPSITSTLGTTWGTDITAQANTSFGGAYSSIE